MNIRKTAFTAVVAFVSAFAAVAFFNRMGWNKQEVSFVQANPSGQLTAYSASRSEAMPIDFRYAASASTPAVVHIKSTFKAEKASYGNDPLRDLFGDDYKYFFHGPSPYGNQPQVATGSGVIVSTDGYIVTNNHVVENAEDIEVVLNNQKTYKAKLIGRDEDVDVALLKIEDTDLPAISFANSDSALVGEWVLAVGNPFNLESTVTAGIISAKGRNINILGDQYGQQKNSSNTAIESFIQTDAAVNPGNSGGALVNVNGELIGINTAIASPTGSYAGYSFAVPSNIVKKVIFDLQKYGVTQRGFLGVTIRTMDDKTAHDLGFSAPKGVYVDGVNKGSAADEGGLKNKDVITDINGFAVNSSPELQEQVAQYRPGDKITVNFIRDGKPQTTTITLKNKYNTTASVETNDDILGALGVEVENLSASDLRNLGISGGVRVTNLKDGKLSEFTDIRKGFVITQVDDQQVNSVNDFINLLKNKSGKVLVEGIYPNKPMSYLYAFRM